MASCELSLRMRDEAEQLLVCQICAKSLLEKTPRALQCLHTFCEVCLERCIKHEEQGTQSITCPTCRQQTELPREGVRGLPKNFAVSQTDQFVRSLGSTNLCRKCLKKGQIVEATTRCSNCETCFCDICCTVHNDFPGFRSHNVIAIAVTGVSESYCSNHKRVFECYCKICNLLLCTECLLDGEHDSHRGSVETIKNVTEEFRAKLSTLENRLKDYIRDTKRETEERCKALNMRKQLRVEISETARNMKRAVDQMEQELMLDLDRYLPDESPNIQNCQESIRKGIEFLGSIKSVKHLKGTEFLSGAERSLKYGEEIINTKGIGGFISLNIKLVPGQGIPLLGKFVLYNEDAADIAALRDTEGEEKPISKNKKRILNQKSRAMTKPARKRNFPKGFLPIIFPSKIVGLTDGTAVVADRGQSRILRIDRNGKVLCTYSAKFMEDFKIQSVWVRRDHVMFCYDRGGIFEAGPDTQNQLSCTKVCHKSTYAVECTLNVHIACDTEGSIIISQPFLKMVDPTGVEVWTAKEVCPAYVTAECINGSDFYIACCKNKLKVVDKEGGHILEFSLVKGGLAAATTIGPAGTLLVADRGRHTISEYDLNGRYYRDILTYNDIRYPTGIFYDKYNQTLWVTECEQFKSKTGYACVKVFTF